MDGNFRLVRKKSSGVSHRPPLHTGRFFVADEAVTPYVKTPTEDEVQAIIFTLLLFIWIDVIQLCIYIYIFVSRKQLLNSPNYVCFN
jgi:hypothetical protein